MKAKQFLRFAIVLFAILASNHPAWADDPKEQITLSNGSFSTDHITWSGTSCTIQQIKGSSSTAVNSSYISAPRVYKGHILSFEAKEGYKIKSISITVSNTYYGNSMTAGISISNNTVTDNTSAVSRTWTSTLGGTHVISSVSNDGLSAIHIQNVASTNVQLRFTAINITYVSTTPSYTITASSNNNSYGTVSVSGTTITATPADCYQVVSGTGGYTVTNGTATVSHTGTSNTLTVTPSTDCTVRVNFEKKTVNTYIDEIQDNGTIEDCSTTAPSLTDKSVATTGTCAQQHYHFMGWVTAANKANPTDANIIEAGETVAVNGTTYYAVWAKGVSSGEVFDSYTKVTTAPLDWTTDKYVLVCTNQSKILTGKASAGNWGNYASFDADTEYSSYELTIAATATANYYSIKLGNKYLSLTSNGNNLYFVDSYTANGNGFNNCDWQLYKSSNEFIVESPIKYTISNNSTWRAINYNKTSGQERFACYKYDTQEKCVLYKRNTTTGTTYSDYITTCCQNLGQINGSVK